jgi:1,2-diacylglycerol 3-alpha-glucosyltransferase
MRILMVSDVYFPRVNGVSTSIETFRKTLAGQGVEVRLVVPRYGDEPDEPGIVRVAGRPVPGDPEDRLVGWRAMHRTVLEAAQDCDLIHIQTPVHRPVRRPESRPHARPAGGRHLSHAVRGIPAALRAFPALGLAQGPGARPVAPQCNALDAVIVPSTAMQQRLNSYGVTVPLHVLPTGIPLAQFAGGNGQAFRYQHGILSTRPLALFVGRVAHEKNIGFLLEALVHARQLRPDVLLVVAGEGPAMDDLKAQVKSLGLRDSVQFIGYLDRKQALPDCYAAANAFVFASRTETQGLVLLEAMAAGLPVIALSEMGTTDILSPGRGAISPPAEVKAFGETLGNFLNQPSAWHHLRQEAPVYAQEWSDVAMAARLACLYREQAGLKIASERPLTAAA